MVIRNGQSPGMNDKNSSEDVGKFKLSDLKPNFLLSVQQKMELVQVPEKSYGNFYEGDCYVLLSVSLRKSLIVVYVAVAANLKRPLYL